MIYRAMISLVRFAFHSRLIGQRSDDEARSQM